MVIYMSILNPTKLNPTTLIIKKIKKRLKDNFSLTQLFNNSSTISFTLRVVKKLLKNVRKNFRLYFFNDNILYNLFIIFFWYKSTQKIWTSEKKAQSMGN